MNSTMTRTTGLHRTFETAKVVNAVFAGMAILAGLVAIGAVLASDNNDGRLHALRSSPPP